MFDIIRVYVLYSKIVHHERERYVLCFVVPKSWSIFAFMVPERCQFAFQSLVSKDSRLR